MAQSMKIDFIADVVCPWCYIGWKRLKSALVLRPQVDAEIIWRTYQLDPMLPDEGVDRKAYMAGKFTDPDRRAAIMQALSEAAEGEGIVMNLRAIPLSPNTNAAQRLIRWAQLEGRQEAALEAVMAAYFTQLRDIGDPVVLADIAAEIGMDRLLVLKRLSEDTDKEAVTREHFMAAKSGVTGVPFMIFGGKVAAVGAESSERLAEAIDKALEMEAA